MKVGYDVTLLSDWHIGTGSGIAGRADARVRRNRLGWTYLPGKTMTGRWRDAAEEVAHALDRDAEGGETHVWRELLQLILGSQPSQEGPPVDAQSAGPPSEALVGISSANYFGKVARVLRAYPRVLPWLTFVAPGVRIGDRGTAEAQMLRQVEYARAGARLRGSLTLDSRLMEGGLAPHAVALLWLASFYLDRVGKSRRRGAGRARVRLRLSRVAGLPYSDEPSALAWVTRNAPSVEALAGLRRRLVPPRIPIAEWSVPPTPAPPSPTDATWRSYELVLDATTPLVIEERLQGNAVQTLDAIPGTLLAPPLLRLLSAGGKGELAEVLHAGLRCGELVISDATLQVGGARGVRVPRVLVHAKGGGGLDGGDGSLRNRLGDAAVHDGPVKAHRRGYVGPADDRACPPFDVVDIRTTYHAVIDDAVQRPTAEVGGLFGYGAIREGTTLVTRLTMSELLALRVEQAGGAVVLREAAFGVGRSKKDEYGQVTVRAIDDAVAGSTADRSTPELPESAAFPGLVRQAQEGTALVIWLASVLLVRDERLRWSVNPADVARALEERLKEWMGEAGAALRVTPRAEGGQLLNYSAAERRDSWNRRWGVPRPSLVGLAPGSVLVFDVSEAPVTAALRQRLEAFGFGERCGEGFGEVRVNDWRCLAPYAGRPAVRRSDDHARDAVAADMQGDMDTSDAHLKAVFAAAWRAEMLRQLRSGHATRTLVPSLGGVRSKAQVNVLRMLARALGTAGGHERVTAWFASAGENPQRRGWPQAALTLLQQLLQPPDTNGAAPLWTQFFDIGQEFVPVGALRTALRRELWNEGVRGILTMAARAGSSARMREEGRRGA